MSIKNILIFANALMGDSIVFLPALKEFQKMYPRVAGYQIYLVCHSNMKSLFADYSGCDEIEYIESSLKAIRSVKFITKFRELLCSLKQRTYEKVIIVHPRRFNYYLAFCVNANERDAIAYQAVFRRLYKIEQYLILKQFNHIIIKDEGYFIGNIYRDLIIALGEKNYTSSMNKIDLSGRDNQQRKSYMVVAPYGSCSARRIPDDMLVKIILYLLNETEMDIYIVGTEENRTSHFENIFKENERVKDYVGLTNLNQLVEMVYNCAFVVAVDSGVIHLAAALRVKNICLIGSWGKGLFLPYDYDDDEGKEFFPRCVFPTEEMSCRNCDFTASRGKGNEICEKNSKSGKPHLCLEKIDIKDVYSEIDMLLLEKEKN